MTPSPATTRIRRGPGRPRTPGLAARRREQIVRAASRCFAERGYRGADVQDVANDLGIGKGTVYRYFPSKRALFQATVDHVMIGLRDAVDAAIRDVNDPLDRIERAIRAYLEYFHGHPDGVELLIQERAEFRNGPKPTYWRFRAANVGRWRALYRGLIRGGRIRPVAVGRVTEMVGDLIYGTMFTNHVARRTRSPGKQADDIVDLVFRGLLTPSQRAQSAPREKELRR